VRSVLLVAHSSRRQITALAAQVTAQLRGAGFDVRMLGGEARECGDLDVTVVDAERAADGAELVIALGGDGTFLRATELARPSGTPMLGVNLGHVGFLAQAELRVSSKFGNGLALTACGQADFGPWHGSFGWAAKATRKPKRRRGFVN